MTTEQTAVKQLKPAAASVALQSSRYYDGVPDYMVDVYDWAYVDPKAAALLDRELVVWVLLFGNAGRLMRRYLNQIEPGMKVWQVAHVYGDLVAQAARKTGPTGSFDVTDITPVQIEHAQEKLAPYPWARVIRHDAATYQAPGQYDIACSFFLLHEIPEDRKYQVVQRVLSNIGPKGKAIFVDYHRPAFFHPVRPILQLVNRYLEPFANAIWNNSIEHYAAQPEKFRWHKETLFGGVYQCVIAEPLNQD